MLYIIELTTWQDEHLLSCVFIVRANCIAEARRLSVNKASKKASKPPTHVAVTPVSHKGPNGVVGYTGIHQHTSEESVWTHCAPEE